MTPASRTSDTASAPFAAAPSQSPTRYCASARWPATRIRPCTDIGGVPCRPTSDRAATAPDASPVQSARIPDIARASAGRGRIGPGFVGAPAPARRRRGGPVRRGRGRARTARAGRPPAGRPTPGPAPSARWRPRRRPRSATPDRGGPRRRHGRRGRRQRRAALSSASAGPSGTARSEPRADPARGRVRGWRGAARRSGSARRARASSPPASIASTASTSRAARSSGVPLSSAAAIIRSAACRQSRAPSSSRPSAVSSAARSGSGPTAAATR